MYPNIGFGSVFGADGAGEFSHSIFSTWFINDIPHQQAQWFARLTLPIPSLGSASL